jgi:hypothetical protein
VCRTFKPWRTRTADPLLTIEDPAGDASRQNESQTAWINGSEALGENGNRFDACRDFPSDGRIVDAVGSGEEERPACEPPASAGAPSSTRLASLPHPARNFALLGRLVSVCDVLLHQVSGGGRPPVERRDLVPLLRRMNLSLEL